MGLLDLLNWRKKGKPLEYAVKMILFILQLLQYILNNGQIMGNLVRGTT